MVENKILIIKLDNYDTQRALIEYLNERKTNTLNFAGITGYIKAMIDTAVKDKELNASIMKALQNYISEHFWAGVYLAKTKPELVKFRYDEMKDAKKEMDNPQSYLG